MASGKNQMPLLFYMPFYDKMGTKESNGKEVVMVLYNGKKRLPSGIEDFEELISQDFYYVHHFTTLSMKAK